MKSQYVQIALLSLVIIFSAASVFKNINQRIQTAAILGAGSGLIAYYSFDDGTAVDSSGGGVNGTIFGATATPGKINGALLFDGVDDYVSTPSSPLPNQFTFSVWARKDGAGPNDPQNIIISQYNNVIASCSTSGKVDFEVNINAVGGLHIYGGACPATGTWAHYAGTYDGTTAKLYLNGTFVGSLPVTGAIWSNYLSFVIGRYSGGGYNFKGAIDDVRVYNRALDASEIAQLYTLGSGTAPLPVTEEPVSSPPPTTTEPPPPTSYSPGTEHIYLANTAQGSNNGTSCANAKDTVWLNYFNSIDESTKAWSSQSLIDGKIGPGDTLHLCGTFSNQLYVRGSGTIGKPITILFESNAKISIDLAVLRQNEGINASRSNWIIIDGGTNGVIEALNSGTDSSHVGFNAITALDVTHFTVQNLTMRNMYVRNVTSPPWNRDITREGQGVNTTGSDITIKNNLLNDGDTLIGVACISGTNRNVYIQNNRILRSNHGITIGSGGPTNCFLDNVIISDNYIDGEDTWENDGEDLGIHRNGIIIFNESQNYGGGISNLKIYKNHINQGKNPKSTSGGTGGIFIISYKPEQAVNVSIFNNLFTNVAPIHWSNGFVVTGGSNVLIANNTMIGWTYNGRNGGGSISAGGRNIRIYNNLKYFSSPHLSLNGDPTDGYSTIYSDYNVFDGPETNAWGLNPGGTFSSFIDWKAYNPNFDPHTTLLKPVLDSSYIPLTTDVVARGKGMNLTLYCSSIPELCKDKNGNQRPSTGAWTIGAFEQSGGTTAPPPTTYVLGDFNKDGYVNSLDFSAMSGAWNTSNTLYDLNKDGTVNTLDYSIMVQNWTK